MNRALSLLSLTALLAWASPAPSQPLEPLPITSPHTRLGLIIDDARPDRITLTSTPTHPALKLLMLALLGGVIAVLFKTLKESDEPWKPITAIVCVLIALAIMVLASGRTVARFNLKDHTAHVTWTQSMGLFEESTTAQLIEIDRLVLIKQSRKNSGEYFQLYLHERKLRHSLDGLISVIAIDTPDRGDAEVFAQWFADVCDIKGGVEVRM